MRELGLDRRVPSSRRAATAGKRGTGRARAAANATSDRPRQIRTVHAVDRREDRILPLGLLPALLDRRHRERHAVGRLVTAHAGAAVLPDGLEERMALRLDGAARVEDAQLAPRVRIRRVGRQPRAFAGRPPARRNTRVHRHETSRAGQGGDGKNDQGSTAHVRRLEVTPDGVKRTDGYSAFELVKDGSKLPGTCDAESHTCRSSPKSKPCGGSSSR